MLQPVCDSVDHHQAGDAAPQNKRGRDKCSPQPAGRVEPAMASERDHDVPLQIRHIPAGKSPADFRHHRNLKQATGKGTDQTARCHNLSERKYRHSYLAAISPYVPTIRFNGQDDFYYPAYPASSTYKNYRYVPKVMVNPHTKVGFSGVTL